MTFKMHWDALVDYNDHFEIRGGIHIICADSEKDSIKRALKFLHNEAFIDWDAFIENDTCFIDLCEYH